MPKPSAFGYLRFHESAFASPESVLGGVVTLFVNDANNTLKIGDAVVMSSGTKVDKINGATSALLKGVVVAGAQTDFRIPEGLTAAQITAGVNAALVNEQVLVMVYGTFFVVCDGAVAFGSQIKCSTTAGKVTSGATYGLALGWLADIAAAADGDVRLAFISPH